MGLKVGDNVRILDVDAIWLGENHWNDGDVVMVVRLTSRGLPYLARDAHDDIGLVVSQNELHAIERIDDDKKPPKKQRIEALEHEVAALKAEMETLRDAKKKAAENPKTANQLRAEVIADAKSFVKKHTDKKGRACLDVPDSRPGRSGWFVSEIRFEINAEKRTVVALAIGVVSGRVVEKAIAKCAPDDVFNADIGKAIAVGRLFGLDVERFINAPKPDKLAVGTYTSCKGYFARRKTVRVENGRAYDENGMFWYEEISRNIYLKDIDDTEAQYE